MNQETIRTLAEFIPEDIMKTETVKNLMRSGNLNEALKKTMEGKSLKERRSIAENLNSIRKGMSASENEGKKYAVLVNSSRKIKRQIISSMDVYIPEASLCEQITNFKIKSKNVAFTDEERELLGSESSQEDAIFVAYDKNNKTINRRATQLLGYPVGGNVIFYNKNYDIDISDIIK